MRPWATRSSTEALGLWLSQSMKQGRILKRQRLEFQIYLNKILFPMFRVRTITCKSRAPNAFVHTCVSMFVNGLWYYFSMVQDMKRKQTSERTSCSNYGRVKSEWRCSKIASVGTLISICWRIFWNTWCTKQWTLSSHSCEVCQKRTKTQINTTTIINRIWLIGGYMHVCRLSPVRHCSL